MERLLKGCLLCLVILFFAGCGSVYHYLGFWQAKQEAREAFSREQSAELLMQLAPEDAYLLLGKLTFNREPAGPVLLLAVTDQFKKREIAARSPMQTPLDYYQIHLPEGVYEIYFFADLDKNGYFEAHECVGSMPRPVTIAKHKVIDGLSIAGPDLKLDLDSPAKTDLVFTEKVRRHSYVYESLDDEFFDPRYGQIGLYDFKIFMAHTQQYIFSFETMNLQKTQVIFVHGVAGTPRDFKYLAYGLDRSRYQPWFYFYPSGLPLKKLGANLANIIKYAEANNPGRLRRLIIVAHSMGGLVALSTIHHLSADSIPPYLKGYISFNSPYGGVEAAASGIKYAPAVVPSWHDVAAGSPFLKELYAGRAHKAIPFYLFFGYKTGESGDGTITLQSQLDANIHLSAYKSYGFNASHVGILHDDQTRQVFYKTLSDLDHD
ncbi:MAG: putative lipase [Deltaproteobacteria bacterium]